jgi:hypothetical protein
MATKTDKKKGKKKAAAAVNVSLATFDHCVTRPVYRRLRRGALGAFPQVGPGEYQFVEGLRSEKDVDPDAAGKVLAVITTDGLENRSREVSVEQLQDMIEAREADGWTFIFLGAKQDAWATGTSYGLSGTVSGQTVSTQDSPAGTLAALREGAGRTASYLGDQAKFRSTYSAQSANTVLSEDGKLSVNESQNATPTPGPKRAKPKSEPYGDVADALERAASATRSPGAS